MNKTKLALSAPVFRWREPAARHSRLESGGRHRRATRELLTLKVARASSTARSMKSSDIRRDGCSLKTEFIRAILAALRRASALVGQFCNRRRIGELT